MVYAGVLRVCVLKPLPFLFLLARTHSFCICFRLLTSTFVVALSRCSVEAMPNLSAKEAFLRTIDHLFDNLRPSSASLQVTSPRAHGRAYEV